MKWKTKVQIIHLEIYLIIMFFIICFFLLNHKVMDIRFVAYPLVAILVFFTWLESKEFHTSFVTAKSGVLFSLIYFVFSDILLGRAGLEIYSNWTLFKVLMMVFLFIVMFLIAYLVSWKDYFAKLFLKVSKGKIDTTKLNLITIIFYFIGLYIPLILWGGGLKNIFVNLIYSGREAIIFRNRWGGWVDFLKSFLNFFKIAAVQLSWFHILFSKKKNWFIILSAFIVVLFAFNSGSRTLFVAAFLPFLILFYFKNYYITKKPKSNLYLVGGVLVILIIMQFMFIIRNSSPDETIFESISKDFEELVNPTEYHRDDQFNQLARYNVWVPERIPYSGEWLVFRPFYHWIPRAIWENKPDEITTFFEDITNLPGEGITTWSGSIIGDFYIAQGWFGIIIAGLIMGFFANQVDSLRKHLKNPLILLLYAYSISFLVMSVRGWGVIYESWYIFILIWFVFFLIKK